MLLLGILVYYRGNTKFIDVISEANPIHDSSKFHLFLDFVRDDLAIIYNNVKKYFFKRTIYRVSLAISSCDLCINSH